MYIYADGACDDWGEGVSYNDCATGGLYNL